MGFGRFRKLFRREPTRRELYLQLARGLNIERDYQTWIETWENYGPAATPAGHLAADDLLGRRADHRNDDAYWSAIGAEQRVPRHH